MVPVTSYVAPSSPTNPSPPTVTPSFVSAVPSYSFWPPSDVRVTFLGVIVNLPSVVFVTIYFPVASIVPTTFFSNFASYSPASVPFALTVILLKFASSGAPL